MNGLTARMGEKTFVICVLWLAGWSAGTIAARTGRARGSVKGMAQRRLPKPRDEMTVDERQALLDVMKADRRDGGALPDEYFVAAPLRTGQRRKIVNSRAGAELLTRREAEVPQPQRILKGRELRRARRREELKRREEREHGLAVRRGAKGSALEYLANVSRVLVDPSERDIDRMEKRAGVSNSGIRRLEAGLLLRKFIAGTRIGGLGSVDYETTSTGSALGLPPSTYKLYCIETVGLVRAMMTPDEYRLIEAIVDADDFAWERVREERARARLHDDIRRLLDIVAVHAQLFTPEAFESRWGSKIATTRRPSRQEAARRAETIAALLDEARRTA